MADELYPLAFEPVYMPYIWGGRRLATRFGREIPGAHAAESWEISDRPEGMSVIANGPLAGCTLAELTAQWGERLVGTRAPRNGRFPLLIKIIDARERVSLQVHPNDRSAASVGGEAKTEAWYILEGTTDGAVISGLADGVGRAEFETALRAGRLDSVLRRHAVAPGDVIFVPGGRVHAIDAGCFLYEVQQNSNTTYRVYDWDRIAPDGRARELHVDQALAVIDWADSGTGPQSERPLDPPDSRWEVIACEHFRIERRRLSAPEVVALDGASFRALFVLRGTVRLRGGGEDLSLAPGASGLIPAGLDHCEIAPDGPAELLVTSI